MEEATMSNKEKKMNNSNDNNNNNVVVLPSLLLHDLRSVCVIFVILIFQFVGALSQYYELTVTYHFDQTLVWIIGAFQIGSALISTIAFLSFYLSSHCLSNNNSDNNSGGYAGYLENSILRREFCCCSSSRCSLQSYASLHFCLFYTLSNILLLIFQLVVDGHHHDRHDHNHYMNYGLWNGSMRVPCFATISVMFTPLFLQSIFPEIRKRIIMLIWSACCLMFFISALVEKRESALFEVVFYCLISYLPLLVFRNQMEVIQNLQMERNRILTESKEDIKRSENLMKSMVGNMAHDLKTPLSSFMAGVKIIEEEIIKCEEELHQCTERVDLHCVEEMIGGTKQCISTINNTNSFMLMTINRCIDYTKASKGLKLVPKYETIDLMETLSLPLNCMKDIQQRVSIVLEPLSRDICSHVITDKQWLQENVLCLLSNAVKYSSEGVVKVCVSLVEQEVENDNVGGGMHRDSAENTIERTINRAKSPSSVAIRSFSSHVGNYTSKLRTKRRPLTVVPLQSDKIYKNDSSLSRNLSFTSNTQSQHQSVGSHSAEYLCVEVEDEGIGMSDEVMKELFSPFKQAQRLAGGTGLGLFSLSQRIGALHGQCGVRNREDGKEGSVFWFHIPYRPDAVSKARMASIMGLEVDVTQRYAAEHEERQLLCESGSTTDGIRVSPLLYPAQCLSTSSSSYPTVSCSVAPTPQPHVPPTTNVESDLRILLVDDSAVVLRMLSMMLRKQGYDVCTAENGSIALHLIQRRLEALGNDGLAFDVILSDLQMPVMDGLEFVKRLRDMEGDIWGLHGLQSRDRMQSVEGEEVDAHVEKVACLRRHLIIGLSANSDEETIEASATAGFDGFLGKPFTLAAFVSLMASLQFERGG